MLPIGSALRVYFFTHHFAYVFIPMKILPISIALLTTTVLASCGSKKETAGQDVTNTANSSTSGKTDVASSNGVEDCILSHQRKLDELLPLVTIKKHFVGDMPDAEMKYRKSDPDSSAARDEYLYRWKGDQTTTVKMGTSTMTMPISNEIGVKWVGSDLFMIGQKATPLENFKAFYRNPSQEEMDKAFKIAEAAIKNDTTYSKEQTEAATDLAKGMAVREKFKDVPNIGDAASFNLQENYLTVLVGATTFQIVASVGKDKDVNLDLAKKLATEVLTTCQ